MTSPSTTLSPSAAATPAAASLRARAVTGLKIASLGTVGKIGVDLLAQFILLRLLLPTHFGLFATAQTLSGLVSCFTDLAGQKFLVRDDTADDRAVSTVFWFELSLAIAIAVLWVVLAGPLLTAMGKPEQIPFARALALWIVAERLLLPRAVLDRALAFGKTNIALFGGVVAGAVAAVACAFAGLGAWSFIAGLIVRTATGGVFLWALAGWMPRLVWDGAVVRHLLRFGVPLSLSTALAFAYTNLDYIIVGQMAGYGAVGLYYAAYRYPHYLNQINILLAGILFPSFSRARDDAQLARGFAHVTRYAAAAAALPVVLLWTDGEVLLRWLLGERWLPALFAFQCFTTLAAGRLAFIHWGQVAVVKGHTRLPLVAGAINLPLVCAGAWIGVRWAGIDGAALLVTVASLITLAGCCTVFLPRLLPTAHYAPALQPALRAMLAALLMGLMLDVVLSGEDSLSGALRVGLVILTYGVTLTVSCGREALRLWTDRRPRPSHA